MKEANNNAIDLMLRSLARAERGDSWPPESDGGLDSQHLDADELNLYAEGVLTQPAKARYTTHLADCQRCRTLVVGLAQSAGLTVLPDTKKPSGSSIWRNLSALFSIPVLRYAIPVLLLTGMISIGLVALRNRTNGDLVAVNQPAERAADVLESNANSQPTPANALANAPDNQQSDARAAAAAPSTAPSSAPVGSSGLFAQQPKDNNAEKGRTEGATLKDAPVTMDGVTPAQPVYAPEVYQAPPPPKVAEEADRRSTLQKEKQEYANREVAKRGQDELKLSTKDDSPSHGPARSRSMSGASRRDEDVIRTENRVGAVKDKKEGSDDGDTLTVSGRSFRRRGNAWIDTAYSSSRSVTNVSRGSEQFRSLMADEPGLRTIVQQLGGEVIVVWKNRVYRIR